MGAPGTAKLGVSKTAARGAKIRPATFDDYEQIAALEMRQGIRPKPGPEWIHLWRGNPAYRELREDWTIGWVVENADGRIVASVGNIPLLYEFEGKRIVAASGRAQVAEPEYRSATLLLVDQLIRQPGADVYLNSTMSAAAAASFSAFECPRVPTGAWDESGFWIVNYAGFCESVLRSRKYPASRALSYPAAVAASLIDRLKGAPLREHDAGLEERRDFDDRFDGFWEALKKANPHALLALRTREALEWHFQYALVANRLWIVTAGGAKPDAYAIFLRKDNSKSGLKRVRLVDFQAVGGGDALLAPMLSWALRKCRREGIHVLENIGRWMEKGEFIEKTAPHRRKLSTWTFYYRANDPELAKRLANREAWALASSFDGDATL